MLYNIIQSIINIPISAILTITMFVLLAISVLFGMLRGMKKTIFYTIFYIIGVAVFFLTLGGLTNALLNFNLSNFGLNVNGVTVKSLNESIPEIFRSFLSQNNADLSGMFVKGTESYILVTSILKFVAQLVLTIAFIIVFQIVYKIILWFFWILFGKRLTKSKKYNSKGIKTKKHRLIGGVLGLVPGLLSVFMIFVPLSGIFSVASSLTSENSSNGISFGDYLSKEDYKSLQKALGSYEESAPGKVFNIIVNKDGTSLDVMIFDKITNVQIDDRNVNIRKDLENIGIFANEILSTGLLDVISNDNFTSNELINVVQENSNTITPTNKYLFHKYVNLGNIP